MDISVKLIYFNTDCGPDLKRIEGLDYTCVECNTAIEMLRALSDLFSSKNVDGDAIALISYSSTEVFVPEIIARAVGLRCDDSACASDGIQEGNIVLLPEGSIPLTSEYGRVSGFLLEKGKQTIIAVDASSDFASEVFESRVLPYVSEKSGKRLIAVEIAEKIKGYEDAAALFEQNMYIEDVEIDDFDEDEDVELLQPESVNLTSDENFVYSYDEKYEDAETEEGISLLPKDRTKAPDNLFETLKINASIGTAEDGYESGYVVLNNPDDEEPVDVKDLVEDGIPRVSKGMISSIIVLCLVVIIALGGFIGYDRIYVPYQADVVYSSLNAYYGQTSEKEDYPYEYLSGFGRLYDINSDLVGWLKVYESEISLPVVSSVSKGTAHHRSHLFDGSYNRYGTPYTSANFNDGSFNRNIIIRAKNTNDGRLFSNLQRYLDLEFLKNSTQISFSSLYSENLFEVISVFSYKDDRPVNYTRTRFLNDEDYVDFLKSIKDASYVNIKSDISGSDQIITLVSTSGSQNIVVVAKKTDDTAPKNPVISGLSEPPVVDTSSDEQSEPIDSSSSEPQNSSDSESSKKPSSSSKTESKPKDDEKDAQKLDTKLPAIMTDENSNRIEQEEIKVEFIDNKTFSVPDLKDVSKADAVTKIKAAGLTVGNITTRYDSKLEGTVLEQVPTANAKVKKGTKVDIVVSAGMEPTKVSVPNVLGFIVDDARNALENDAIGLVLGDITTAPSYEPEGTIIDTKPAVTTTVEKGTKVNVVLSDGSVTNPNVTVENLVGLTKAEAEAKLRLSGLSIGKVVSTESIQPANTVIYQYTKPKSIITMGQTVDIIISNGVKPPSLTVRNQSDRNVTVGEKQVGKNGVITGDCVDIVAAILEAEMGSSYNLEALKAQAVATYCFLLKGNSHEGTAVGAPMKTPGDRAIQAAKAVAGIKVMYGDKMAQTYYFAMSAGYTAKSSDIWTADIPYLNPVNSTIEKNARGYETHHSISEEELRDRVLAVYGVDLNTVKDRNKWIQVTYDDNDTYARAINYGGLKTAKGVEMRTHVLQYDIKSSAFKVTYSDGKFDFVVHGYGHGVGLSQVGANLYASNGWTFDEILTYYYKGTTIS